MDHGNLENDCPDLASPRARGYRCATTVVFLSVCLLIGGSYLWIQRGRSERQRGRLSFNNYVMREAAGLLNQYRSQHGYYPPVLDDRNFYAPLDEVAPGPYPAIAMDDSGETRDPSGPVDPNRQSRIFPNEAETEADYFSSRNPDGWVCYAGYSLRYFRPAHGRWALIIGNAPDKDADIDQIALEGLARLDDAELETRLNAGYSYDPTNGADSNGDVWRKLGQ